MTGSVAAAPDTSAGPSAPVARPLERRAIDVATLARTSWDVVIVGGGIVGSGALLDAASRGMRAALIEQDDIAAGTSSRSSRLIHGGLRYLEQFRFGLVREALAERSRLLELAPHLVRIEPLLFPIYGIPYASKAFYDAGLTLYDILGARHDGGWHGRLSKAGDARAGTDPPARRTPRRPALSRRGRGRRPLHAGRGSDRDGRRRAGGHAGPGDRSSPAGSGAIAAAPWPRTSRRARRSRSRRAPWSTRPGSGRPIPAIRSVAGRCASCPAAGAHLVVPRERIANKTGLTIRVPGKIVFLVPWPDHWLIGTTDAPFEGPAARPAAAGWEVDRLLDTVNATMDVNLTRDDVVGTYAGLRPLVAPSGGSTVKASREHRVTVEANGVVRIGGGKYTTYRVMARDVIDSVLGRVGRQGPPERHRRATAHRRRRHGCPGPHRRRAHDDPGVPRARPEVADGSSRGTARRRRPWSPSAAEMRPAPSARRRPPVPRGRGRCGRSVTSSRCHSTTCWLAGRGWPRSCRTAALRSRRAWPQIMAGDLDWGDARRTPRGRDLPGRGAPRVLGRTRRRGRAARRRGDDRGLTERVGSGRPPARRAALVTAIKKHPKVRYWQRFLKRVPSRP